MPFTPNNSEQRSLLTCYPRLLARNWPELIHMLTSSQTHFLIRLFLTYKSALQSLDILRTRGVAPSDLRPLRKILSCCLP